MNNEDVTLDIEGRTYVNPQTGLDERMEFINTLRDVQAQNTAEINQNTYNLGSQVPSNVGGLTGSEGLWQAQYQTPQTDAQIANLRAVAQQNALNQATQNLQSVYQNQYKQALRNFYKRNKNSSGSGTTPLGNTTTNAADPTIETIATDTTVTQVGQAPSGWAYIPNPMGGDRWYRINEDGSIDYSNYVDKNPASQTTTQRQPYTDITTTMDNSGTYVTEDGKLRKQQ